MSGTEYAEIFAEAASAPQAYADRLFLPRWGVAEWRKLLAGTAVRPFKASDVVIRREATERTLFFIAEGTLDVGVTMIDGLSVSSLARIGRMSIIGEQSFFDGAPRSANVWAITDGTLLCWDIEAYERFGEQEPALARDLLFALGRVLSSRLRMTSIRVRR
jgi:CRP/FNR family cyclic AMP-dependent transcriptional regulator